MNLILDFGNTRAKIYVYNNNKQNKSFEFYHSSTPGNNELIQILRDFPEIKKCIISSTISIPDRILKLVEKHLSTVIVLTHETPIPIENLYETKQSLGKDRLAAAIGANTIFPCTNVMIIDLGTAITFDFVNNQNQYLGGTISPGLEMRFIALHKFTQKLPMCSKKDEINMVAKTTHSAIISGVQNGIQFEIEGYINRFKEKYTNFQIIMTGGDANFFDKRFKNTIFVSQNLVAEGLNRILEYNGRK